MLDLLALAACGESPQEPPISAQVEEDADGDPSTVDSDDDDVTTNPGAPGVCFHGVDNDCSGWDS